MISDEDIKHLHNTISRVLDILRLETPVSGNADDNYDPYGHFESAKELINMDTLKTMQLLGFNYKAAIGEPLTQLCANAIISLAEKKSGRNLTNQNMKKR